MINEEQEQKFLAYNLFRDDLEKTLSEKRPKDPRHHELWEKQIKQTVDEIMEMNPLDLVREALIGYVYNKILISLVKKGPDQPPYMGFGKCHMPS